MTHTRKAILAAVVTSSSFFLYMAYRNFYSHADFSADFYFRMALCYLIVVALFAELLAS